MCCANDAETNNALMSCDEFYSSGQRVSLSAKYQITISFNIIYLFIYSRCDLSKVF